METISWQERIIVIFRLIHFHSRHKTEQTSGSNSKKEIACQSIQKNQAESNAQTRP